MKYLSGRELGIISLRNISGLKFREIAEKLGVTTERVRQIYIRALKRQKMLKDISKHSPEFFTVSEEIGLDDQHFYQLCSLLDKNHILKNGAWRQLSEEDYRNIFGLGTKYIDFLQRAKTLKRRKSGIAK